MPAPSFYRCIKRLNHREIAARLANHSVNIHEIDELGTYWHNFARALHIKNLNGELLQATNPLTLNALNIFVELATRWVDPAYELPLSDRSLTARDILLDSNRKTPGWAVDSFTYYLAYYAAKKEGATDPQVLVDTTDPIALDAINKFLARAHEFDFATARQQALEVNSMLETPALTGTTTLHLPSNPVFAPAHAGNLHRRPLRSVTTPSECIGNNAIPTRWMP